MPPVTPNIESVLQEERLFPPPQSFAEQAHIKSFVELEKMRDEALADPESFWARMAEELHWFKKWDTVLKWDPPHAEWFGGGKINIAYNCLDRHLTTWRRNKAALIWEGEPGETRTFTYQQLHTEVCKFANVLKHANIQRGDRVALYMPLIPELAIAMLACARIGATHSVVFGGFSSSALIDRINDASCKLVVTADGGWRRGTEVKLKPAVDEALKSTPSVNACIVVRRTGSPQHMEAGRDFWWHELMETVDATCAAEELDSEHPLYILYTSGTTGKPKGILHTTAGYLLQAHLTTKWVFDLKDEDLYWCTADIGWVTGHSYVVYGPLSNGATVLMYEGAPKLPGAGSLLEYHRTPSRKYLLHCSDRHSRLHQVGRTLAPQARSLQPASTRHCRRTDQSGSMDVVSRADRQATMPDSRYLVANRNRRDHDHAVTGSDAYDARFRNKAFPRNRC